MLTSEISSLYVEFIEKGKLHAEKVFEKHVGDYCKDGRPFLSLEGVGQENLVWYAHEAMALFCRDRFAAYSDADGLYQQMDVNLLLSLYVDLFSRRYLELLPKGEQ